MSPLPAATTYISSTVRHSFPLSMTWILDSSFVAEIPEDHTGPSAFLNSGKHYCIDSALLTISWNRELSTRLRNATESRNLLVEYPAWIAFVIHSRASPVSPT